MPGLECLAIHWTEHRRWLQTIPRQIDLEHALKFIVSKRMRECMKTRNYSRENKGLHQQLIFKKATRELMDMVLLAVIKTPVLVLTVLPSLN